MQKVREGRVWCLDDNVDTDQLIAGKYLTIIDPAELRKHVLEGLLPAFAREAREGDILVAGENFGCGSSREHAPQALRAVGLGALVANSFARIFFRNSINLGLPAIECPGVRAIFRTGETARIDLERGEITNVTRSVTARFPPFPPHIQEILDVGGLVEKVRRELRAGGGEASA
jgi:3-isopropylmalate/(R)-2-methylmalate dehydratase small subunit